MNFYMEREIEQKLKRFWKELKKLNTLEELIK
jgi:hypothetical protein